MSKTRDWVTVVDVARELKVETSKDLMWTAGALVRNRWVDGVGTLPVKDLRRKTNGPGVHCFALYPPWFKAVIVEIIQSLDAESSKQQDLW